MPKINPKLEDKEWLYEQYVINNRSCEDIGIEINVQKSTVARALKRLNIKARPHTSKYSQFNDKEWLRRMYFDEMLSTKQIADLVGSTVGNVASAFKVMGLELRSYKAGQAVRFPDGRFGKNHPMWKGGMPFCEVCREPLSRREAIRCRSCEGKNRLGADNINWKGGITPENVRIRSSKEYILWRNAVFERDDYTCRFCSARSGKGKKIIINADHIKPFAYFPDLRLDINNGRTLCEDCHKKTDTYAGRMKNYAKKNGISL